MPTFNSIGSEKPIQTDFGGTGVVSLTDHGVLVGSAALDIDALAPGTNGQVLVGSTGLDPVFAALTSTGGTVTFTTGAGTLNLETTGAAGHVNQLNGDAGSATPTAGVITLTGGSNITTSGAGSVVTIDLDNSPSVSGTLTAGTGLIATTGGLTTTGTNTFNALGLGVVQASAAGVLSSSTGNDGQVLIDSTAAGPSWANIASADSSVTITNAANSIDLSVVSASGSVDQLDSDSGSATPTGGVITIAGGANVTTSAAGSTVTINATGSGGGFTWNEETGTSVTMVAGNGYITNNAGMVTCTLPATAAVGTSFRVVGKGNGLWTVAQNASQQIYFAGDATTIGVGGYLEAVLDSDCVEILCITANTEFQILSSMGNITIV